MPFNIKRFFNAPRIEDDQMITRRRPIKKSEILWSGFEDLSNRTNQAAIPQNLTNTYYLLFTKERDFKVSLIVGTSYLFFNLILDSLCDYFYSKYKNVSVRSKETKNFFSNFVNSLGMSLLFLTFIFFIHTEVIRYQESHHEEVNTNDLFCFSETILFAIILSIITKKHYVRSISSAIDTSIQQDNMDRRANCDYVFKKIPKQILNIASEFVNGFAITYNLAYSIASFPGKSNLEEWRYARWIAGIAGGILNNVNYGSKEIYHRSFNSAYKNFSNVIAKLINAEFTVSFIFNFVHSLIEYYQSEIEKNQDGKPWMVYIFGLCIGLMILLSQTKTIGSLIYANKSRVLYDALPNISSSSSEVSISVEPEGTLEHESSAPETPIESPPDSPLTRPKIF